MHKLKKLANLTPNRVLVFTLILLTALGTAGVYLYLSKPRLPARPPQQHQVKEKTQPGYKYVTQKPTGWFTTGQDADLTLYATGFNESGGPLALNHPGKIATDGSRLIVSDTWNNRVLIWNKIPTAGHQKPDLVLGQPDFNSNNAGLGSSKMNWPMGVATDGEKLLVSDANNDRVLIWNQFPSQNGQPADLVLGVPDFDTWPTYNDNKNGRDPTKRIYWAWDVWTDGEKVVVTSTTDGSVLVWNKFPTQNNQPADLVLGHPNFSKRFIDTSEIPGYKPNPLASFGTPRSIASDGERLVIGDYNARKAFVWNTFPTTSGKPADFTLEIRRQPDEDPTGVMGLEMANNKLYAAGSHHVFVWEKFPASSVGFDKKLGKQRTRDEMLLSPDTTKLYADTFAWPVDVAVVNGKMLIADTNNNRVLVFNSVPKETTNADIALGQPDLQTDWLSSRNSRPNPMPFSNGEKLVVGSDGVGAFIYNHLPNESKAAADVAIGKLLGTTVVGGHTIIADNKLIMVHREGSSVFIWNQVPEKDGALPDVVLGKKVVFDDWGRPGTGPTAFNNPQMVASDGEKLFVTDSGNNRILIWNTIPTQNQTPADLVLGQNNFESTQPGSKLNQLDTPIQVATDGKRLAVADQNNRRVLIWENIPTENGAPADLSITQRGLTSGVDIEDDHLFVADTAGNRILVWTEFPQNISDRPDIVIGQNDFESSYPANGKNKLFVPTYVDFDGAFLWVGEMKWSNRLLRFSVGPGK